MATYNKTGTAANNTIGIGSVTNFNAPASGSVFNINGAAGSDTFQLNNTGNTSYNSRFQSAGFVVYPANASGVIVVSGASSKGETYTFNLTSVETLVFSDKTITLSYGAAADTTPPVFASATVNGSSLVMTYTEANTLDATNVPAANAFTVSGGHNVTGVAVNAAAKTVTLTLATAVANSESVTVAYTDPTTGNDVNAIQDAAGNDAVTLAAMAVTNNTPVPTNHAPTGAVTITGTATQGQTLTETHTTLADADGLGAITIQWYAAGTAISGATGTTYTLTQTQVGKAITVKASYTDGLGKAESMTSTGTAAVLNVNDLSTGSVTITGTAASGQKLTASHTLADLDGLGTISYQWKAGGINIGGATTNSLALTQSEVGKIITVLASYTDMQGTKESVISVATAKVTAFSGLTLTGTAGADVLNGGSANDTLYGLAGNDSLDGGTGADMLVGGTGDDTYFIDNTLDKITENASEGTDTIQVNIVTAGGTFTLANNVENAKLVNSVAFNLTGNALANVLTGNAAANALDGGAGADTLTGGSGSDTYTVDNIGDVIVEAESDGTDLVKVKIATAGGSYTLANNVENASLQSTVAFNLNGNALANTLIGNGVANTLTGAGGNDTMTGGLGIDTFNVDSGSDTITDLGNGGSDILKVSEGATANATVSALWTATTTTNNSGTANITTNGLGVNLGAVVTGNGYNVTNTGQGTTLTGSGLADLLSGSTGKDTLIGGNGNDVLNGGNGNDALTGGAGSDTFLFSAAISKNNVDVISDFQSGSDKISLLSSLFANIKGADGVFNSADLLIGAGVTKGSVSGNEHLIFSTSTKALYYDADGSGAGAGAQFATLTGVTTLADTDFMVS